MAIKIAFPKIKSWSDVERLRKSIPECERKVYDRGDGKMYQYEVRAKVGGPPLGQFRTMPAAICFAAMHETVYALRKMVMDLKKEVVRLRQLDMLDKGDYDGPV